MNPGVIKMLRFIFILVSLSSVSLDAKALQESPNTPAMAVATIDEAEEATSEDLSVLNQQLDINTATESQWQTVKGVGPKKAKAILEYKALIGGFKSVDDLLGVRGIGQKALAKMRPMLKV